MIFPLSVDEVQRIVRVAVAQGIAVFQAHLTPSSDRMSQREAYRRFGKDNVLRWLKADLIHRSRSGPHERSTVYYSAAELTAAEAAEITHATLARSHFDHPEFQTP